MPTTPALPPILDLEDRLQSAWQRGDRAAAAGIRAQLATLWRQRREELARLSGASQRLADDAWNTMPCRVRRQP